MAKTYRVGLKPGYVEYHIRNLAAEAILNERLDQLDGRTTTHDDILDRRQLDHAAICYIMPNCISITVDNTQQSVQPRHWPFEPNHFQPNPDNRLAELAKAGAFVLAEMERIIRSKMEEE